MAEHATPPHDAGKSPAKPAAPPKYPEALTKGGPVTTEAILDRALASTDLPPRGEDSITEWANKFDDPELIRRITNLLQAASVAADSEARHWAHQAEDQYLRKQIGGKNPSHT